MARQSGPKPDALPGCATPRHPEAPSFPALSGQAESSVRGNEWQNEAGTGEQTPGISQNPDFEKALTANPDVSGVSGSIAGETGANAGNSLAVAGGTREEWRGTKRQREALRKMFGGKCAYCGNDLGKSMHADHVEPVIRITRDCMGKPLPADECYFIKPERNTVGNIMPACAPCNLHKGGYGLEEWRRYLERSAEIVRKQTSTFRAGERFGIITVTERPITFFFERITPEQSS